MAVTREEVIAALEQFLPRTVNFSRSEDLGEYDKDAVFQKIVHIVLTSLLVDKDTIFYLVYLSSQRLLTSLDEVLATLEDLEGDEQLRGISPAAPERISDLAALTGAQNALTSLSGSLITDTFGVNKFTDFSDQLHEFLSDQVVPNVRDGGNSAAASKNITTSLGVLAQSWAQVLERQERVFQIVARYQATDLRVKVSANVISSIRQYIADLLSELPEQTTVTHGQDSRSILINLAAAEAAIKTIAMAPSPFGEVVAGPTSSVFTDAAYLDVEGVASVEPVSTLLRGSDGRVFFDDLLISASGQTVFDGDTYTANLSDTSVPDFTAVVSVGDYITIVDRGERGRLQGVTASTLTMDRQTAHSPSTPLRYVVTSTPAGTYFKSAMASFWDEFVGGQTASTVVASGTQGTTQRINKITGVDGKNIKTSGTGAILRPYLLEGASGTQTLTSSYFSEVGTTFLSSGVLPDDLLNVSGANSGGNPYTVATIESETTLTITTTWGSNTSTAWSIERPDAAFYVDLGVNIFALGILTTDNISITSGSQQGTTPVDTYVTTSTLKLTASFAHETGLDWEVRYANNQFVSPSGGFLSANVQPGDVVNISTVGVFTVLTIDSDTTLTLASATPSYFSGKTFQIYDASVQTTKFVEADAVNLQTAGVAAYVDGVPVYAKLGATSYGVVRLDSTSPTDTLYIDTQVSVVGVPFSWSVRVGDETNEFTDSVNSPFGDYAVNDVLVYKPGTLDERRVAITSIVSNSEVTLSGTLPQGETGLSYALISTYKNGLELIVAGRKHEILQVVDEHTLEVYPPLSLGVGKNFRYLIVPKGTSPFSYRLVDEVGALSFGPSGFPSHLVGNTFEFVASQPLSGKVLAIIDVDADLVFEGLDVDFRTRIGQSNVGYRIRSLLSDTTDQVLIPEVDFTDAVPSDVLTLWTQPGTFSVSSSSFTSPNATLVVSPVLPARLEDQLAILVRGGSVHHGRYLLLEELNSSIILAPDTSDLRLSCAQVLLDLGNNTIPVSSGPTGDLSFDEDGDGQTNTFRDLSTDFTSNGVVYGTRIDITMPDASVRRTYVVEIVNETTVLVAPQIVIPSPATGLAWEAVRSSVSNALEDLKVLKDQVTALREVIVAYVIPQNSTLLKVLNLLRQQHMDRAVDLLYNGDITAFIEMNAEASSYSSYAKSTIQVVGGSTAAASSLSMGGRSGSTSKAAGIDPATGKSATSATRATRRVGGGDEVETRISMANGVTDLSADELVRSMLQLSLDEARNRSIYELTGEVVSGAISDQDPTLPWIAKTGSVKDRLNNRTQEVLDALQYMIDHPDQFEDVST